MDRFRSKLSTESSEEHFADAAIYPCGGAGRRAILTVRDIFFGQAGARRGAPIGLSTSVNHQPAIRKDRSRAGVVFGAKRRQSQSTRT